MERRQWKEAMESRHWQEAKVFFVRRPLRKPLSASPNKITHSSILVILEQSWLSLHQTQECRFSQGSYLWQIFSVPLIYLFVDFFCTFDSLFIADYVCILDLPFCSFLLSLWLPYFMADYIWFTFLWWITVNSTSFCAHDQFSNLNCSSVSGDLPASKI